MSPALCTHPSAVAGDVISWPGIVHEDGTIECQIPWTPTGFPEIPWGHAHILSRLGCDHLVHDEGEEGHTAKLVQHFVAPRLRTYEPGVTGNPWAFEAEVHYSCNVDDANGMALIRLGEPRDLPEPEAALMFGAALVALLAMRRFSR